MGLELFDLSGKVALITGSSRGIGLTLAEAMGDAGATVVLNSLNEERLYKAVEGLSEKGIETYGYAFDVTDSDQIRGQVEAIERGVGPIEILVNNAGIQIRAPLETFDEEDWERLLRVNLTGAFLTSQVVVKGMLARGSGKIINICSMQSELGRPTITPYAASKGGLKMLTKGMATEWGRHNIQVNGLGPGYFVTSMTRPLVEDEQFDAWLCARVPANRWGDQSELAGAAIFLASDASSYVNGHILYVDGGMLACV